MTHSWRKDWRQWTQRHQEWRTPWEHQHQNPHQKRREEQKTTREISWVYPHSKQAEKQHSHFQTSPYSHHHDHPNNHWTNTSHCCRRREDLCLLRRRTPGRRSRWSRMVWRPRKPLQCSRRRRRRRWWWWWRWGRWGSNWRRRKPWWAKLWNKAKWQRTYHIDTNWPPFFFFFTFLYICLIMWSSCDHFVTYCSCDVHCSVMSIVLWPIVQVDSIVPVTPIVLVTLLFSFTISTGSLWPYSLGLDFLYFTVHRAIRAPFPHSSLVPSTRDCHGFLNPCRFWVGYTGVWVQVGFCEPLLNPYPQGRLAGFPWDFHLWRTGSCTMNLLQLMNIIEL